MPMSGLLLDYGQLRSNAKSAGGSMPKATRSGRTRLIACDGHSLHFGLSAPPTASQASVPGVLRRALHVLRIVLLFFPVPPSLRQAAGPLTENLPNVSAGDPSDLGMDLLLERPSPRGTKRRPISRVLPPADWLSNVLARLTTKRGHLA